jgi:undecaprenyl pyrophosphate phosphatase UppP
MKKINKLKAEAKGFTTLSSAIIIGLVALLITYITAKEFFEVIIITIWIIFLAIIVIFKSTSNAKHPKSKSIVEINKDFMKKYIESFLIDCK